ncbi:MAG: hypothetical protein NC200_07375 [Candidatus Gastranaerophilales bacterium]|nr:hypothetical protein [Candidatus Gastranaerophilales bacterium]
MKNYSLTKKSDIVEISNDSNVIIKASKNGGTDVLKFTDNNITKDNYSDYLKFSHLDASKDLLITYKVDEASK